MLLTLHIWQYVLVRCFSFQAAAAKVHICVWSSVGRSVNRKAVETGRDGEVAFANDLVWDRVCGIAVLTDDGDALWP